MQSGITASSDLHAAFNTFTSTPSLFALPITISSESLQPLDTTPFPSAHSGLFNSIHTLSSLLTPTDPLFLLLRRSPSSSSSETQNEGLIAITYIPSRAPVRQKTLFAATRNTLMRELGNEKFSETVFLTEKEEILDPAQWDERAKGNASASGGKPMPGSGRGEVDPGLLTAEERELQAVKRAEEEERHGTRGRDLMGEGGSGFGTGGGSDPKGYGAMKLSDETKDAIASFKSSDSAEGKMAVFSIDSSTEIINLISSQSSIDPSSVLGKIPTDKPSYTLYQPPSSPGAVFIYACPSGSKIKSRMIHASSRLGITKIAARDGVEIVKRFETGDPDELGGGKFEDEISALGKGTGEIGGGEDSAPGSGTATPKAGFARPKRPGRDNGDESRFLKQADSMLGVR